MPGNVIDATEDEIANFWEKHPCGEQSVGGMSGDLEDFFARYDAFRYVDAAHILRCLAELNVAGKNTLEIGLGQGADSEQLIKQGAIWSGLDLTQESVNRVATRLLLRKLPHVALKQGSVLSIPYESDSFDLVFSHGVLHHVPNVELAQREIHRILRPGGELVVMLYAKYSLNYLFSICLLRRIGLLGLCLFRPEVGGIYGAHIKNAKSFGLTNYLKMRNFIHRNTDGPDNQYSKVYSLVDVRKRFPLFRIVRVHKEYMHAPPLNLRGWPGSSLLGWHLWAHMAPR